MPYLQTNSRTLAIPLRLNHSGCECYTPGFRHSLFGVLVLEFGADVATPKFDTENPLHLPEDLLIWNSLATLIVYPKSVHRTTKTPSPMGKTDGEKRFREGGITIDNRRLFINLLSEIRLFPRRRLLTPSLGNSLSNRDINLGRRHNFVFSIDFRQALAVRRMCSAGITASYTKCQSVPNKPCPKWRGQPLLFRGGSENGWEGGLVPVNFFSEEREPVRAAALMAVDPLTVVCRVEPVLNPIFVTVSQSLSPIVRKRRHPKCLDGV